MPLPRPEPGLLISYSYLWREQKMGGENAGRKTRPCAIVLATNDHDGDTVVYVAAVTHRKPASSESAIELPLAVKSRLGLDALPSWVVTTELNRFVWPGYDLRPISRDAPDVFAWGFLPASLFEKIKASILSNRKAQRLGMVDRE